MNKNILGVIIVASFLWVFRAFAQEAVFTNIVTNAVMNEAIVPEMDNADDQGLDDLMNDEMVNDEGYDVNDDEYYEGEVDQGEESGEESMPALEGNSALPANAVGM